MKKFNKILKTAILGLAALPAVASAQTVSFVDIDASAFPKMSAKLLVTESDGTICRRIDTKALSLADNGANVPLTVLCQPENIDQGVSFILAIDVSRSMESAKLAAAKSALSNFVKNLRYRRFECAVYGMANEGMPRIGYTSDREKLTDAINTISVLPGSDVYGALSSDTRGAFHFADLATYNSKIIIITDNLPNYGFDKTALVNYAQSKNLACHFLWMGTEGSMPNVYKEIATETGGSSTAVGANQDDLNSKLLAIEYESFKLELCQVQWAATDNCSDSHSLAVKYMDGSNTLSRNYAYSISAQQVRHVAFSPAEEIDFGFVPIGTSQLKPIVISAVNGDIDITNITSDNSDFRLTDFQAGVIPAGQSKTFHIEYNSQDSASKMAIFTISSNACSGNSFWAGGGSPFIAPKQKTLKVDFPNGGEKLIAGRDTSIRWSGALPNGLFAIDYSTNAGTLWTNVTMNASGNSYLWKAPNINSDQLTVRVRQLASGFANDSVKTFVGQNSELTALAWSPNGVQIASGGLDGSVRLWDVSTGAVAWSAQFTGRANSLEFSPNGVYVAGCADDSSIVIWNASTGAQQARLAGHKNKVNSISWLGNTILASGSNDKTVLVWDVVTQKVIDTIKSATEAVYSVAYSPDSKTLAIGSADNKLRLRDLASSTEKVISSTGQVKSIAWSPDSKSIAISTSDMQIYVYDAASNAEIKKINAALWVNSISWSPDGSRIISGNNDGSMFVWEVGLWTLKEFSLSKSAVNCAKWGPVGPVVATVNSDSIARIYVLNSIPQELQKDESDAVFSIISPSVSVTGADFGFVYTFNSKDSTLAGAIKNNTSLPIRIADVAVSGQNRDEFSVVGGERSFVLGPGEAKSVEVCFKPKTAGAKSAALDFYIEDENIVAGASASITGTAPLGDLAITEGNVLNFMNVTYGGYNELYFHLVNNSTSAISLPRPTILSDYFGSYSVTNPAGSFSIPAGGSETITVRFEPKLIGVSSAILRFERYCGLDVLLHGNGMGQSATMTLTPADVSAKSGDIVEIPIVASDVSGIANSGISKVDAYLYFNANLLSPVEGTEEGIVINGTRIVPVTLTLEDLQTPKKLKFKSMLGNAETTPVGIINAQALTGRAFISLGFGNFSLLDVCHEGGPRLIGESGTFVIPKAIPNPASAQTQLVYQVIENGNYKLRIYDASGELVSTMVDEYKKAGAYSIEFDARAYPAGAYLLVLETPTQVVSSRLVVVK